jgi:hypothetical protein
MPSPFQVFADSLFGSYGRHDPFVLCCLRTGFVPLDMMGWNRIGGSFMSTVWSFLHG